MAAAVAANRITYSIRLHLFLANCPATVAVAAENLYICIAYIHLGWRFQFSDSHGDAILYCALAY